MGPPRRNPPSGYSISPQMSPQHATKSPQGQQDSQRGPQSPPPSMGMSLEARYKHNLKVLQKRDPSITSIFDQFGHACVYIRNGQKWDKLGYEGSMFLFERKKYPPYGFFILNRAGLGDYLGLIYPEDDLTENGQFAIVRSYPDFIAQRLASIKQGNNGTLPPDPFSDLYYAPGIAEVEAAQKGQEVVFGLWSLNINSREPLITVLQRVRSYALQNIPYPESFRYGPGKPPPSHRLRVSRRSGDFSSDLSDSQSQRSYASQSDSESDQRRNSIRAESTSNVELDRLFAKMEPTQGRSVQSTPDHPPVTQSNPAIDSLFVSALEGPPATKQQSLNASARPTSTAPPCTTGLSLLNSIFASAENIHNPVTKVHAPADGSLQFPSSTTKQTNNVLANMIYSPQPSIYTPDPHPQVLNLDVISTLLGLPSTRSASSASTTYSIGAVSHPSSREGDNEDDGESDAVSTSGGGGHAISSNGHSKPNGATQHRPETRSSDSNLAHTSFLSGMGLTIPGRQDQGRVNGDVTPRALLNGSGGSVPRTHPPYAPPMESISSIATVRENSRPTVNTTANLPLLSGTTPKAQPNTADGNNKSRPNRPLVPFAPDSELWPYLRGPVEEQSPADGDGDDGDIVELNFEETSVLSDPEAFNRVLRNKRSAARVGESVGVNGHEYHVNNGHARHLHEPEKGKGKKGRKSKKERDAREREEIENSWDIPPPSPAVSRSSHSHLEFMLGEPASPSPCPSPELRPQAPAPPAPESKTPTMTVKTNLSVNGNGMTQQRPVNGTSAVKGKGQQNGNGIDHTLIRESIINAAGTYTQPIARLEKSDFVQELLSLIHTDKVFVEALWQDYTAHFT